MKTIEEKLKELKAPVELKWRVQSAMPKLTPTHVIMIGYVDARDVMDRLDEVIGAGAWQSDFKSINNKDYGGIGILINGEWIWKWDVGSESNTEKDKGLASDAFKRAGVKWGINRYAYSLGTVKLQCKMYNGKPYPCDDRGNFLRGKKLYDTCNKLVNVDDLEISSIEISDTLLSEMKYTNLD